MTRSTAPTIIEHADPVALGKAVRAAFENAVAANDLVTVPTGRTPAPLYAAVSADGASRSLWSSLRYLQLDEYIAPPAGTETFAETLARQLFDPLGLPEAARGAIEHPEDPATAAALDARCGEGLRLALLGMGSNGHIAFNEPGDTTPGYHRVTLHDDTVTANFGAAAAGTTIEALTIGIDQLLAAEEVFLWVPQERKQPLLDRVLAGPIDPQIPASALLAHPRLTVFRRA